jgi:hypothetical protein
MHLVIRGALSPDIPYYRSQTRQTCDQASRRSRVLCNVMVGRHANECHRSMGLGQRLYSIAGFKFWTAYKYMVKKKAHLGKTTVESDNQSETL